MRRHLARIAAILPVLAIAVASGVKLVRRPAARASVGRASAPGARDGRRVGRAGGPRGRPG